MKLKFLYQAVFLLAGLCAALPSIGAPPINLSCAFSGVSQYYNDLSPDSEFIKDVNAVVGDAERYLNKRVIENNHAREAKKLAVILDIDDTSLSNYKTIKTYGFGSSTLEQIDENYHAANAPAISPVLRLYNEAISDGVAVFFITARKPLAAKPQEDLKPYTINNLQKAGYANWTELYLPQGEALKLSSQVYKTNLRKNLIKEGYDIILNIGDQDSDIAGGYADHTDKIPNFLYSASPALCSPVKLCQKN